MPSWRLQHGAVISDAKDKGCAWSSGSRPDPVDEFQLRLLCRRHASEYPVCSLQLPSSL